MGHWWGIIAGILLSFLGAQKIITGKPGIYWGGVPIPAWTGWFQLPAGIALLFLAIRGLRRDKNAPKPIINIDEEAKRAEAELDAMYLREHGKLPEKNKKDT